MERPSYVRGLQALLRAIDDALPDDAVLFVEGPLAHDVKEFLSRHSVPAPIDVERGILRPKLESFHLPLEGTNLAELRQIAERHAGPEVCDHLVVYHRDEPLLWAHDAGDGYVLIAKTVAPETISQLGRAPGEAFGETRACTRPPTGR